MAASFRRLNRHFISLSFNNIKPNSSFPLKQSLLYASSAAHSNSRITYSKLALVVGGLGISGGLYGYLTTPSSKNIHKGQIFSEKTDFSKNDNIPEIRPSREVSGPAENLGLDLTLYQYQSCPFCCKVRAFLDFYGLPYKVIEVNPVMKQQIKFSTYKKVPILVAQEKDVDQKHQLNDSTVIISILGSLINDISTGLQSILQYYTPLTSKDENGKEIEEIMNKYFLMYGNKVRKERNDEYIKKEREWRKWADSELVHILSPNIYRTYDESLQAFKHFSDVGEWEKNFSSFERFIVIYTGATVMYFIGKRLKKKYSLKPDVRQSLYDSCKKWTKGIGPGNKFMGGNSPNLADLAVYGLLSSIEGCTAFQDSLDNTNIGVWYYNVKEAVNNHYGYQTLKM